MWCGLAEEPAERVSQDLEIRSDIDALFGQRYQARTPYAKRVVITTGDDNIQFAGLVHENSPPSGAYGGMSLIWFPVGGEDSSYRGSLITLVCGTRGLSPDEHILARPGHSRHLRAMQKYLKHKAKAKVWVKSDPTNLNEIVPKTVQAQFENYANVFKRYGTHIYACAEVSVFPEGQAEEIVKSFLDFYAWERGWQPLAAAKAEVEKFKSELRSYVFPEVSKSEIVDLLEQRRFVILQGPPGTGKTRMAAEILKQDFADNGFSVQFHPAVTYETFVAGISPQVDGDSLNFRIKPGWLAQAINGCGDKPYLFHADEINRADLSRVLGEAIYLFEPGELAAGIKREIRLPQPLDGNDTLSMPQNLFMLGTMNSADRSIAIMDMAVRRRFAFVDIWPSMRVVADQGLPLATEAFAFLQDIFSQYASEESFNLMPGHSYFLAADVEKLETRFKFELLPLLREYLQEGRLASCEIELRSYIDWLENKVS